MSLAFNLHLWNRFVKPKSWKIKAFGIAADDAGHVSPHMPTDNFQLQLYLRACQRNAWGLLIRSPLVYQKRLTKVHSIEQAEGELIDGN